MYRRLGIRSSVAPRARRSARGGRPRGLDAALAEGLVVIFASHCGQLGLAAAAAAATLP